MANRAMWRQCGRMTGKNWLTDQPAGMETMLISTLLSRRIPRAIACSHNFRAEDGSRSIGLRIIARFLYARKFRRTRAICGLYGVLRRERGAGVITTGQLFISCKLVR